MRKIGLSVLLFWTCVVNVYSQCNINNATNCSCLDGSADCDLLPNIIVADEPLLVAGSNGVIEYSQTGNGLDNGRLRVSVSTPNIGRGPLTVISSQIFICGVDTFTANPGTCPDGSLPRQLIWQRVYHKNGNVMTYTDRPAGSMTYHPTHSHMHVDDWGEYSLRVKDTSISNPLLWPIVGQGAKLGFCLMDYGTCSYYNGHCEDSLGNILLNSDFPNYGLGGGSYSCSSIMQGISSGYTDIYYQNLDGMYISIPPTTCNGQYYIVVNIDPHNYFLEENENDNVIVIPYTLTKQVPAGVGAATISVSQGSSTICEGSSIILSANPGNSYLWSNNQTTQNISVNQSGVYSVQVTSPCGVATSNPIQIDVLPSHIINKVDATICFGNEVTLSAEATGSVVWYASDTALSGIFVGENYSFLPTETTTLFIESNDTLFGISGNVGPIDNAIGSGGYYSNDQHQTFDVFKNCKLKSVVVYAGSSKPRTIELRNSNGQVLQSKTVNIFAGAQLVQLDFDLSPGVGYQLGWPSGSSPDLYRNSTGASYPYTLSGLVSITGNSANDNARWYGYYDWHIEEKPIACRSIRQPVTVAVTPFPAVQLSGIGNEYLPTDSVVVLAGSPPGGVFSGQGVVGNLFDPSLAGLGGPYLISYTYSDSALNCSVSNSVNVMVVSETGISYGANEFILPLQIFPNPTNGNFKLSLPTSESQIADIRITNVLGEIVWEENDVEFSSRQHKSFNLSTLSKGTYFLTATIAGQKNTRRIVFI